MRRYGYEVYCNDSFAVKEKKIIQLLSPWGGMIISKVSDFEILLFPVILNTLAILIVYFSESDKELKHVWTFWGTLYIQTSSN